MLKLFAMKISKPYIIFCFILVAVCTLVKLFCAPRIELSGCTAIIAVAVFAGLTGKQTKNIFLLPLIILLSTDIILQLLYVLNIYPFAGFYSGQLINYILVLFVSLLPRLIKNKSLYGIALATIAAPTVYFILSNLSVWIMDTNQALPTYSRDISGLIKCYTAGLPFYRNSLLSTVVFVPAFIGIYQALVPAKSKVIV